MDETPRADAVVVHRLGPDDTDLHRRMLALFADVFDDPASYADEPPGEAWVRETLATPHLVALVALARERVVGALVAYELRKFERERSELYLYDLGVDAGHRRRGIATALIAALRGIARERGVRVVFVQADRGDGPAIALYDKLGTGAEVLHFDIEI